MKHRLYLLLRSIFVLSLLILVGSALTFILYDWLGPAAALVGALGVFLVAGLYWALTGRNILDAIFCSDDD